MLPFFGPITGWIIKIRYEVIKQYTWKYVSISILMWAPEVQWRNFSHIKMAPSINSWTSACLPYCDCDAIAMRVRCDAATTLRCGVWKSSMCDFAAMKYCRSEYSLSQVNRAVTANGNWAVTAMQRIFSSHRTRIAVASQQTTGLESYGRFPLGNFSTKYQCWEQCWFSPTRF